MIVFKERYFYFQLLVGSEDFDIRVFKEDEIVAEMSETEVNYFWLMFIIVADRAESVVYFKAFLVQIYCVVK